MIPPNFQKYIFESLQNLWLFKLRSALTLLGVLVGTASVVALISSSQLATEHALKQFKNLGTDLFAVSISVSSNTSNETAAVPRQKLELTDVKKVAKSSGDILIAAPYLTDYAMLSYQGKPLIGSLIAATQELASIVKIKLQSGRFISSLDKAQYVCVIGTDIANDMKNRGALNPLGKQIRVGNHYLTVVGVAKPWLENMFLYTDVNRTVITPVATAMALNKQAMIQNILFQLKPDADIAAVQSRVDISLHRILPDAGLFFRSARELIDGMQKQHRTFTWMLGAIGSISLLVGGIGVMNIMLVSVVERRREIGIRIAVGAKQRDILWMFLTEAIILTLAGGLLGILVGIFASLFIALVSGWQFTVYALPVLFGFTVSVLVGIFFGFYPAYKASELDPIETLKAE